MAKEKQEELLGVINPEELYTLEALKRRLGIRDATLRSARRAGLPVYYKHGRGFIQGRDWIAYVCSPDSQFTPPESAGQNGALQENLTFPDR